MPMIEILIVLGTICWFLFLLGHVISIPYFTDLIHNKGDFV